MAMDMSKFSKRLTLWGSSRVIKKWLKYREFSQEMQEESSTIQGDLDNMAATKSLLLLEDIIFSMRKDMGHRKGGLKKGDMLSFFINNIKGELLKLKG